MAFSFRLVPAASLFVCSALAPLPGSSATDASPPASIVVAPMSRHDGRHDFDFNEGIWRTEIHRILDPLSGSTRSIDLRGTVTVHRLWSGRGQIEEIDAAGPAGRMQGMTLFLYDPVARQWSQTYAGIAGGPLSGSLIGSFENGRGTLIANDTFDGRAVLVRAVWSQIEADSHRFEEAYSDDGGRTWFPAFIAHLTRITT